MWIEMSRIIKIPPIITFIEGCSWITSQTQIGPKTVSKIKNNSTSWAAIYLGAKVIKLMGINTKNIPIIIIRKTSIPSI